MIVFAVERFNDYSFGRRTVIHFDYKQLESMSKKLIHRAPCRLHEMIHLQEYNLGVQY